MVLTAVAPSPSRSRGNNSSSHIFHEQENGRLANGELQQQQQQQQEQEQQQQLQQQQQKVPRAREVSSRYKSPTSAPSIVASPSSAGRRYPSPVVARSSNALDSGKRAVSAERRRLESPAPGSSSSPESKKTSSKQQPTTPRGPSTPVAASSNQKLWPSSHRLQSSMQLEPGRSLLLAAAADKPGKLPNGDLSLRPASNGVHRGSESPSRARKPNPERKPTPERKSTPSRRVSTDHSENAKPRSDVNRWPASSSPKVLSRSVDFSSEKEKDKEKDRTSSLSVQGRAVNGMSRPTRQHAPPIRSLSRSMNEGPLPESPQSISRSMLSESRGRRNKLDTEAERSMNAERTSPKMNAERSSQKVNAERSSPKMSAEQARQQAEEKKSGRCLQQVDDFVRHFPDEAELASLEGGHPTADNLSDCESISSAGSSVTMKKVPVRRSNEKLRASVSEQDFSAAITGRRLKSLSISGASTASWSISPGRLSSTSQPPSPSNSIHSSCSFRSMPSPTRTRISPFQLPPSGHSGRPSSVSSLLNFPIRAGKKALSQQEEAHSFRVLHNRWLQWRFVNARADAATCTQQAAAERSVYNAWLQTLELRKSVAMKRIKLQQARGIRKVQWILASQGPLLETWAALQQEHSAALSGSLDALEAAVLRVPVTGGAKADVQALREALGFAVHVTSSLESSLDSLMPKTEKMGELVMEIAEAAKQEKMLLEECSGLLETIAALEVEERSFRTHFAQLECEKVRHEQNNNTNNNTDTKLGA